MAATVSEFFDNLKSVDAAKTAGMRNSYLFDIEAPASGSSRSTTARST